MTAARTPRPLEFSLSRDVATRARKCIADGDECLRGLRGKTKETGLRTE